jgi:hypothetical protein
MKKYLSVPIFALLLVCTMGVGCSNWEKTTYRTLATTQAAINASQAAYEVSNGTTCAKVTTGEACIEHTQTAYTVINSAKVAQTTAVNQLLAYEELKAAGSTTPAALQAAQNQAVEALNQLPVLISSITSLYVKGGK